MIYEEVDPRRIEDLLAAAVAQPDRIYRVIVEGKPEFKGTRLRYLVNSSHWPKAIPHFTLLDSEIEKVDRARRILDRYCPAPGKLLDFGCGEGHVARVAHDLGLDVVGYDPLGGDGVLVSWDRVKSRAPYDTVLLFDVLDHSEEDPVDVLKKIHDVLGPGGVVKVICHPWCGRTGNHSFRYHNKAFLHLIFDEDELEFMGCPGIWTRKVLHPWATYDLWFRLAGYRVKSEEVTRDPVEGFFKTEPLVADRIAAHWGDSPEEQLAERWKFPEYQMEQTRLSFELEVDQ